MHVPETDPVNARREARATRRLTLPTVFIALAVVGMILALTPELEDWSVPLWWVSVLCLTFAARARFRGTGSGKDSTSAHGR